MSNKENFFQLKKFVKGEKNSCLYFFDKKIKNFLLTKTKI